MPTIVYYHVENINGMTCMMVTSKRYWDAHHVLDDGGGPDYERIVEAMETCGIGEATESVYELAKPSDAANIVTRMKRYGFDFRQNQIFSRAVGCPR